MARSTLRSLSPGRALIGLALVTSAALVGTNASIQLSVEHAFTAIVHSQASALLESVRDRVRLSNGALTGIDLSELMQELRDRGLRYLSLGDGTLTVGKPLLTTPPGKREHVTLTIAGSRARLTARLLRRRWRPGSRPAAQVRRLLRSVTLELEPTVALRLRAQARRSLWISVIVALAVIGLALLAARWTRRRQELEQQLEDKRRLAALGQMSAVLAHELRNPLASLKGHAQLLEELVDPGQDRIARKVGQVVHEAQRLETLSNELLEFVRTGSIDRRADAPLALVEQLAGDREGRVAVEARDAPPSWNYDPPRLRRVLTNLIDNALQASPPDTQVTISVGRAQGALLVTVRDHGPGVADGELEQIFEPFHTGRTRGTGLGLAVARRIVEAHGGTLTVANAPDGGACFSITLPQATAPNANADELRHGASPRT